MLEVSLQAADAVLLVFSVSESDSFSEVALLRDRVMETRGQSIPIVVTGNKTDLEREVDKIQTESIVSCDWENSYVECSAKMKKDIDKVFLEVLDQIKFNSFPKMEKSRSAFSSQSMKRRQSLPAVAFSKREEEEAEEGEEESEKEVIRRTSIAKLCGEDSCIIC